LAHTELKISINQALHGYQNGHQLLAASISLSLPAKRTLLFQSDLSGSIEPGFESYITGYPIKESNIYVLAKTWYAPEMERPGCVWTHSLLIEFSDIGKIPDLSILNALFRKPQLNEYETYNSPLFYDAVKIVSSAKKRKADLPVIMKAIMKSLYESPDDTVIITQNDSGSLENDILQIWNEQWPRLRRNFTFCTGALSLKTLDDEEYDLQIIPERLVTAIKRQSKNAVVVNLLSSEFGDWSNAFTSFDQQDLRKFLWTFGADIEGKRSNYIPLLNLFQSLYSSEVNLDKVNASINAYFPDSNKGKFLKKNIYGAKSILPISEKELINFLLSNSNNSSLNLDELQLSERIINLINKEELSVDEFIHLFKKLDFAEVDDTFWKKVNLPLEFVFHLMETDAKLIPNLLCRWPKIAEDKKIWTLNYSTQREILYSLKDLDVDWEKITDAVISSESKIIYDLRKFVGRQVTDYSLQLINKGKGSVLRDDWIEHIIEKDEVARQWIWENRSNLRRPIYILIFGYLSPKQIEYLGLDSKILAAGYEYVSDASKDFVNITSCKLLSLGYSDTLKTSYLLVERAFPLVYREVCLNRIGNGIWKYFSKEETIRDHDDFFNPFSMFSYFQKNKRNRFEVEYWDIGRQLIVKTVNRFISNSWPLQSFVATFSGKKDLKEALLYCYTFEKGAKLVRRFIYEIEQGRIKLNAEQKEVVKKILS
jgi:hypothetical protein